MNINANFYPDFLLAAAVYIVLLFGFWLKKGDKARRIFLNTVLYIYIVAVLAVTVMPVINNLQYVGTFPYRAMRLVPFDDYNCGREAAFMQIILNTLMFIPFGFLLPLIRRHNILSAALLSFQFSVFIEVFQPFISDIRYSDVTDVITNTIGGVLGFLLYLLFKKLFNEKEKIK